MTENNTPSPANERPIDLSTPASVEGSTLTRRLRLAINPKLINKNEANDESLFKSGWLNQELTPAELALKINDGVAYCCELSGSRRRENFVASGVLSVDIDGGKPLREMLEDPLVVRCLTIAYKTVRHTEAFNRYRLIFALPHPIESARDMAAASRSLSLRLSGDPAATDAARIFYGSRGSDPMVFDRGIDESLLSELIAQGLDANQKDVIDGSYHGCATTISRLTIAPDQVVRLPSGQPVPFATIGERISICCPFHADTNASAHTVLSKNSVMGIHCATCSQTFWPGEATNDHDFFDFEKQVIEARSFFEQNTDMGAIHDLLFDESCPRRRGLTRANISITHERFLKLPAKLPDGLILVKSPKGTGKTEEIARIVREEPGSVLLIGHRISLIRQSCQRLGLECYLDFERGVEAERVGICLDSLRRLRGRGGSSKPYRTIILDESQQLLSHFLSDTIKPTDRDQIFVDFANLLQRAKRIVALDADLDWLTFETLTKLAHVEGRGAKQCRLHINEQASGANVEVYSSRHHLVGELLGALAEGKRVFVTSNSKALVERLQASIISELGEALPMLAITRDTKDQPDAKAFVMNPGEAAMKYRAILTSPSLGTGVDITFPGRRQEIDVVFGFFESKINTHHDCDQQLARVRDPGSTKVWFNPSKFHFDTSRDVIKHDIQVQGLYKNVLLRYDEDGKPVYHTEDPLIDMAALAVSQQRASKNNLLNNFVELKRRQGCTVDFVAPSDAISLIGKAAYDRGSDLAESKRVELLLAAKTLTSDEYDEIECRIQSNEDVSETERWRMARTQIEQFYRETLTGELILRDDRGRFRQQITRYEALQRYASTRGTAADQLNLDSLQAAGLRHRFLRDYRLAGELLDQVLRSTPVYGNCDFDASKPFSWQELTSFMERCNRLKSTIETAFELEVHPDPARAVKQFQSVLGLVGLYAIPDGKRKRKGKTIYQYRIDPDRLRQIEDIVARRAAVGGWSWLAGSTDQIGNGLTTITAPELAPFSQRSVMGLSPRSFSSVEERQLPRFIGFT